MYFFIAFSNDISCDFESEQWDTGFCNWQYDFSSKNILVRVDAPSSDYSIKRKWKYGNISIIIILHFKCELKTLQGGNSKKLFKENS